MAEIICRRAGRKRYSRVFSDGKERTGYSIMAERTEDGRTSLWVAGFARQALDHWDRPQGWVIHDNDTGEVIFGLGQSSKIGKALADCLYLFGCYLEEKEAAARG